MIVTLTPEIETRLRTFAEDQGLDIDLAELYNILLNRGLDIAEAEVAEARKTP